jgi:hypothetical protein
MEIAYFASTIILVLVAAAGLFQLVLTKRALKAAQEQIRLATDAIAIARDDIRIRVKREAVTVAADQCAKFGEHTIQECSEHVKKLNDLGFAYSPWKLRDLDFTAASIVESKEATKWLARVEASKEARVHVTTILNKAEAFAIYFAKGAADEEVAYPVVGPVFCRWVEVFAPLLISIREKKFKAVASGGYENTISLYRLWSGRTRREDLVQQATNISKKLAEIPSQQLSPIGSD